MLAATAGTPESYKQKGRPVAGRPLTIFNSSNDNADSTHNLRLQRLRLAGIIGHRASVLASLAWGETS